MAANHLHPEGVFVKRVGLVLWICCWLLSPTLGWALTLETVTPNQGVMGQALPVTIKGSGFDAKTRVSMNLDAGNKKATIGSVATPGGATAVTVVGYTAFVADGGGGLQVIDVTTPANPVGIGAVDTPGDAKGIAVVGGLAFVADGASGLQVIDVSTPALPTLIGAVDTPGEAQGIAVVGGMAFVADGVGGLQVIDVTTPANPVSIGAVDTPGEAKGIAVVGDTAFVADGNNGGLQVIDISNPAQPTIIGAVDTPYWASAVSVVGGLAYVADGFYGGLQIIDVSNPAKPAIIGALTTLGDVYGVFVDGGKAFLSVAGNGLQVIDVSNPATPHRLGVADTPGSARNVTIVGNTAFVADAALGGLQIVDVSNLFVPAIIGSVDVGGDAIAVSVAGDTAFVATGYGGTLQVINVGNPMSPSSIASIATPGIASDVVVAGDLAYVTGTAGGLQIIDISSPVAPTIIGSVSIPGNAQALSVVDDKAFVAAWGGGFQVIDVSNPAKPTIIGAANTQGDSNAVFVTGNTAFVGNWGGKLQVIDVSNPTKPTLIGSLQMPGVALTLSAVGNTAYVATAWSTDGPASLSVVDISNPAAPVIISSVARQGWVGKVTVSADTVFVAGGQSGLEMFDISTPTSPIFLGAVETPGAANGFSVAGDKAFVADGVNGLTIIPLPQEIKPVTVVNATALTLSLPSPQIPGNYIIRVFTNAGDFAELPGSVNFAKLDFAALNPNALELRTIQGEIPPLTLTNGAITPLQLVYKTQNDTPINLSNLTDQLTVEWLSSNPEVLSVSPFGVVEAKGPGQATITAKSAGGGQSIAIQVPKPALPAASFGNLIVVAGRLEQDDGLSQTLSALANQAYQTFFDRGYQHGDIYYVNAFANQTMAGEGTEMVDLLLSPDDGAGKDKVLAAITDWAATQTTSGPLYLYLAGHGVSQSLKITPKSSPLTAALLAAALNQFQEQTKRPVVVILEASASGTWKETLSADNRIVLTSTDATDEYLPPDTIDETFSTFLFQGFAASKSLDKSFQFASLGLSVGQNPQSYLNAPELWANPIPGFPVKHNGNLLIVAGRFESNGTLEKAFQGLANAAYKTFFGRGLDADDIYYLNAYGNQTIPGVLDQVVDDVLAVDDAAGKDKLIKAINGPDSPWTAASQKNTGPLYLYLADHGTSDQSLWITPKSPKLYAQELDDELDKFQSQTGRKVVVMVEACFSGTWKDTLAAPNRVVLTSTNNKAELLTDVTIAGSFSGYLFKAFTKGKTLEQAFTFAQAGVPNDQLPQVAAQDDELWSSPVAGNKVKAASELALFKNYTGKSGGLNPAVTADALALNATLQVLDENLVQEVYAVLTPPMPDATVLANATTTVVLEQIKVPLGYQGETTETTDYFGRGDKIFGGSTPPIPKPGVWQVTFVLRDGDGEETLTEPLPLIVTGEAIEEVSNNLTLTTGWNLVGTRITIDVAKVFADSVSFTSLWKWQGGTWAVRLPGDDDGGASYAMSKGFGLLGTISPGEGFWVNSTQEKTVTLTGPPAAETTLALVQGWNLVSLTSGTAKEVTTLVDETAAPVASVWKWVNGTWAVYLPGEVTVGTYANSKGFAILPTINPGEGFWVNAP